MERENVFDRRFSIRMTVKWTVSVLVLQLAVYDTRYQTYATLQAIAFFVVVVILFTATVYMLLIRILSAFCFARETYLIMWKLYEILDLGESVWCSIVWVLFCDGSKDIWIRESWIKTTELYYSKCSGFWINQANVFWWSIWICNGFSFKFCDKFLKSCLCLVNFREIKWWNWLLWVISRTFLTFKF